MRDILKLGEELRTRLIEETEVMLAERVMMRDLTQARGRELVAKREEELRRIAYWAESQKAVVNDVFSTMISENEIDREKHEAAIQRLSGENAAPPASGPPKVTSLVRKTG